MNPVPQQKLQEIVARHGPGIVYDARRCEGLLRDYAGAYRREIAVLVSAIEERVAADLLVRSSTPRQVLFAKLAQRLHDNVAMDENAAVWAVHSWALALGVASSAEIAATAEVTATDQATSGEQQSQPFQPNHAISSDFVVSAAGESNFVRITDALEAAPPGARIRIRPGLYREGIVIHKPVTIVGEGKPQEIIILSAQASCVLMQTTEATLRGLSLRQEAERENRGKGFFAVDIPQGQLRIEACDIASDSLSCVGAHNDSTKLFMQRCQIYAGADSGLYLFNAASGTVEECDIYANRNVNVAITDRATLHLKRSSIHDGKNAGVVAWNHGSALIEECEIFANAKAGVGSSEAGEVVLRRSRIYEGGNSGVFIHHKGRGSVEECDIYGHKEPEVVVTSDGQLLLHNCKIHDGTRAGVFVGNEGKARLEENTIYRNTLAGVSIQPGGIAVIRECAINHNQQVAIQAFSGAEVKVSNCDLTSNGIGPWEIEDGAFVEESGNRI
jgi:nitrous oxidase accessory protein NosD